MMKKHTQPDLRHQKSPRDFVGFTIIELMVATVIFSMVLIVFLASFLQVGRLFYKGISFASTQESARGLAERMSDDIRFASDATMCLEGDKQVHCPVPAVNDAYYFCIGRHRYVYTLRDKLEPSEINQPTKGVQKTTVGGCIYPAAEAGTDQEQLLGLDMQVNKLDFKCNAGMCNMGIRIIFYGADETVFASDLSPPPAFPYQAVDAYCTGPLLSSQFCGVAEINTIVNMRY